jgi:tetraacyldisaccharide 4'-kinase
VPADASTEAAVTSAWQRRGLLAWLLIPFALLYAALLLLRRAAHTAGLLRADHVGVPVVVVGNLYVGGTGKTPLAIELVRGLQRRGWRPGVVSRGYGGTARSARLVDAEATATEVGDEPLLIALATQVPVAVGSDRVAAVRELLRAHSDCDVIVADDGLQHLRLARDAEIALVDERGLGNGWLLPAGPLREPASRLERVDAVVLRGTPTVTWTTPSFEMLTRLADEAHRLGDRSHTMPLAELARRQAAGSLRMTAAAGIGVPERFFVMLRAAGLDFEPLPLPDHYDFRDNPFARLRSHLVLITEKDAVKCERIEPLRRDPRIWVVPLAATIEERLIDLVVARLTPHRKTANGPSTA